MKCIRVLADVNQIKQCKEDLSRIENQTKSISKVLNLAGNEVRLKILFLLYQEGEMCPCDLSDILNMSVPAVSQHLRKLKDGGMVIDKKIGQTVFYSVIDENTLIVKPILKSLVSITKKEAVI
ncbi:MAG: ArsR family transcriptional regulator [Bacteroidetes bacterium]|nr:MAG: ArsR family transcriptional regulator [Bacteroidota bacterium]